MRLALPTIALLASFAISANAGPREDALVSVDNWNKAFAASAVDGIVKLYRPDATFLGTSSKTIVTNSEGIRAYFEAALQNTKWQTAPLKDPAVSVLSDNAVVITGLDSLTGVRNGQPIGGSGRVSFVVTKHDGDWRIAHFHRSAIPN
jgi:uncharacterized protein (TIGR02246 family)